MKEITRFLFIFSVLFSALSFPVIATDPQLEPQRSPSLKTLCCQKLIWQIKKEFDQIKWSTLERVLSMEFLDNDSREMILSHPFSFPKAFFKNEYVCRISEIKTLAGPLKNVNLSNLNLFNLLAHPDTISGRLDALINRTALRTLDLSRNDLPQTFNFSFMPSGLEILNLEDNRFVDLNLDNFPHLTTLNLSLNRLYCVPHHIYVDFPKIDLRLKTLDLSHNYKLRDINLVKRLTSLTCLNMGSCALEEVNNLTSLTNLKTLNLEKNILRQNVGALTTLTNLAVLNVAQTDEDYSNLSPENQHLLLPLTNKGVTIYFGKNVIGDVIATGPLSAMFDENIQ